MKTAKQDIYEFLQYCVGSRTQVPDGINRISWQELHQFAKEHTLLGICFDGIKRASDASSAELNGEANGSHGVPPLVNVPRNLLFTWMAEAEQIKKLNVKLNHVAVKLFQNLKAHHLGACMLKGQGNARIYPSPFSRMPGDIDIWVNASRPAIMQYATEQYGVEGETSEQHCHCTVDDVTVEFHFTPSVKFNPMYSRRLHRWFESQADAQCRHLVSLPQAAGEVAVPTASFNVIYQLCHLQHHFFDEGIGLRQVVDYYYVLMLRLQESKDASHADAHSLHADALSASHADNQDSSPAAGSFDLPKIQSLLHHLDLYQFAAAMMYVEHVVLGLPEEAFVAPMDEKRGKLLLEEIWRAGNFGRHDSKYGRMENMWIGHRYFVRIWRIAHFFRAFPAESFWQPIIRTGYFFRRKWNNRKN